MNENDFLSRLYTSPILWVQTEEDPTVSWLGLGNQAGIDVLTVTSGGCTPLTFLSLGAKSVITIDVNPAQTMVLELKQAAISALSREDSLALFGILDIEGNGTRYEWLRHHLNHQAQQYWDQNKHLFTEMRFIEAGGMQGVGSEFKKVAPAQYERLEMAFRCKSLQEQATFLKEDAGDSAWQIAKLRQKRAERFFGAGDTNRDDDDQVANEMCQAFVSCFNRALQSFPLSTSAWASHMLLGYYQGDALPFYLTPEGFQVAKRRGMQLEKFTTDLSTLLPNLPDASLDGADISNITDLMSQSEFYELCTEFARVLKPGGRLVHRNLVWDTPYDVAPGFIRDEALSAKLLDKDKSFVYQAFTVDQLEG